MALSWNKHPEQYTMFTLLSWNEHPWKKTSKFFGKSHFGDKLRAGW